MPKRLITKKQTTMEQNKQLITQEKVLGMMSIALTKQQLSVQKLQDEADKLEFTEENIPVISAFLAKLNSIDKVTEETHKEIKAPYLEAGRTCDSGKNSNLAITSGIRIPVHGKFTALCSDVDRKKREVAAEELRKSNIKQGIESNVIDFSSKIAGGTTNEELLSIERLINLEKSPQRQSKYGEFHAEAIAKYDTVLKPILKDQKEKIQKKEELDKQIKAAEEKNDVVTLDELQAKKESVEDEILQNAIKIQENAINNAALDSTPVAEEVFADTKSRRSYTIEISDEKEALKKAKELIDISINKDAANIVLKTLKDSGAFKDKAEIIVNGIKYSEIKNYK